MSTGHLPTFILVGAMKCGTTSLHNYLDGHPDICMSTPKEPNFFAVESERDLNWYRKCFQESACEYGESSTNYTKYPGFAGVPKRMHQLLPDVRILYLVRDPVERALSHYQHNCIHGQVEDSVDEEFLPLEESHYLQTSRYYMQISRYLKYYARDQILIIESEKLRTKRVQVMNSIFEFLGVETNIDESILQKEHHATSKKLTLGFSSFLSETRAGKMLSSIGQVLVPDPILEKGLDFFQSDLERPSLAETTERIVRSYLQEDVNKLRDLAEAEFESWSL